MFNYSQVPKTKEYLDEFDGIFKHGKHAKGAKEAPKTEKAGKEDKAKEERGKK